MIEIEAGDMMLILTDGINLRYFTPGEKLPARHQLLIGFEDESCLVASVRMYGGLWCFPKEGFNAPIAAYYETAKNKPQVMTDEFCESYFRKLIYADEAQRKQQKLFWQPNRPSRDWVTECYRISCTMPAFIRKRESIPCLPDKRRNSITR